MEKNKIILGGLDPRTKLFKVNMHLVNLFRQKPEHFFSDIDIVGIQGAVTTMKWASREPMSAHQRLSTKEIVDLRSLLANMHVYAMLDCSNTFITDKSFLDYYDNCVAEIFEDTDNFMFVDSDTLREYISDQYPKYTLLCSSHKYTMAQPAIDSMNNGMWTVIPPSVEFSKFKDADLAFGIAVINPWCEAWCTKRSLHITTDGKQHKEYRNVNELRVDPRSIHYTYFGKDYCVNANDTILSKMLNDLFITHDKMLEYAKSGVTHFMFSDFTFSSVTNLVETYVQTLVVPESKDFVRTLLLSAVEREVTQDVIVPRQIYN